MKIYIAYVLGDDGGYDEVFADSPETAMAAANLEFIDYFGQPIEWGEPNKEGPYYNTGYFKSHAHTTETVIVSERAIMTMEDVERERDERG